MLTAHDAADVMHLSLIGDHGHARVERVSLAVERQHLLTVLSLARNKRPCQLGSVIDMQRSAKVNRDEIGDVDQR